MADEDQLKILRENGVITWNAWRDTHRQTQVDLSGADLSEQNLKGAYLRGADLTGAELVRANLRQADLVRAKLSAANLSEANLHHANLQEVDVTGAKLSGVNLSRADLIRGNLRRADLSGAYISGANLGGANLTRTDLRRAHLHSTHLGGTDLSEATFGFTEIGDVDLSRAKGVETISHWGPSEISISTIYRSGGNIPEVFLLGAGVPEPFIGYMKSLVAAMSPVEFYSCFISYSHVDKAFARRLHDSLQARGIRCWLDEHQLLPGDDIYHEVDRGIRLWDKMLLCCSESSLKSWWVDNEIGTAFDKEQQLMKDREGTKVQVLVPLNLDGYLFTDKWQSGYQTQVKRRLAADFTEASNAGKFAEQVERLIKALRADEGAREKPPKQRL